MQRPRLKPTYLEEWHGAFENYARSFVVKNYWRVRHIFDFEEAVQETACIFSLVRIKYRGVTAKHLMALYKTALKNNFNDFATKSSRASDFRLQIPITYYEDEAKQVEEEVNYDLDGYLDAMPILNEASRVLQALANTPGELLDLLYQFATYKPVECSMKRKHMTMRLLKRLEMALSN